jgi:hypothetical protein
MSDGKTRNITLLAAWIALIVLLGGALWFFTQNLRYSRLLRSVNAVLESAGDTRRLERIPPDVPKRNALGFWYYEETSLDRALVFSVMNDGILQPCLAWFSPEGSVTDVFSLRRDVPVAHDVLDALVVPDVTFSQGIINVYKQRFEQSVLPELKHAPVAPPAAEPVETEREEEP